MDSLTAALYKHYGWRSFRDGQRPILEAILDGRDSLAVLPTGGGKSLCFQLPALIREGLVVVVSPLVALMEDQVMQLKRRNIQAACLHSGLTPHRLKEAFTSLEDTSLRLLYLAPERLQGFSIREALKAKARKKEIVAFAIDEAHCISAWGHDFRPDYRKLDELRTLFPGIPFVALTATAGPRVRADIIRLLQLRNPFVQVCSGRRKNLFYSMIRRSKTPIIEVLEMLKDARGASLIYASTRRSVEQWTASLRAEGIPAIPYHAGLDITIRQEALEQFLELPKPVLVATVAFGMGVDRGDVGLVLHLNLPTNPERYIQESGRAGRDGLPAKCIVLFSPGDRKRISWAMKSNLSEITFNSTSKSDQDKIRVEFAHDQLRKMEEIAEGALCREQSLLLNLGELSSKCGRCDRCKNQLKERDWSLKAKILLTEIEKLEGSNIVSLVDKLEKKVIEDEESWGWLSRRLVQDGLLSESNDAFQRLYIKDSGRRFINKPWPLEFVGRN